MRWSRFLSSLSLGIALLLASCAEDSQRPPRYLLEDPCDPASSEYAAPFTAFPLYLYDDEVTGCYRTVVAPEGFRSFAAIDPRCRTQPDEGQYCIEVTYLSAGGRDLEFHWLAGGAWGDVPGLNLSMARRLSFSIRGGTSDDHVEFYMGGLRSVSEGYPRYMDTLRPQKRLFEVPDPLPTADWAHITVDLAGLPLCQVVNALHFRLRPGANPDTVHFYLDNVRFE